MLNLNPPLKGKTNQKTPIDQQRAQSIQQSNKYILKANLRSLLASMTPILSDPRSGGDLLADRGAKEMPEGGQ